MMKKTSLMALILAISVTSCKKSVTTTDEPPLPQQPNQQTELPDSTLWGHLGEDTGMSTMQFITEQGDTLELYRTNPYTGEDGRLTGEVRNLTDRFAITITQGGETMLTAINATQLAQTWKADGGELNIKQDGTVDSEGLPYNGWKLWNGHILLSAEVEHEYGKVTRIDTMDILWLDEDSLVILNHINQQIRFIKGGVKGNGKR